MKNIYTFTNRKAIELEARQWLIKFDNGVEPSQPDIRALREWIDRSPAHRVELVRISAFWHNANVLSELAVPLHSNAQSRWDRMRTLNPLLTFNRSAGFAVAAVLTIAVTLTLFLSQQSHTSTNGIYATAIGELQVHTLADGSVIQINTDSQLQVSYSDSLRKIRLIRGEAHFNVIRDLDRPFEVYAGEGVVTAVGTGFSIRLEEDTLKVTVSDGRVDLALAVEYPEGTHATDSHGREGAGVYKSVHKKIGSLSKGQSAIFNNQAIHSEDRNSDDGSSIPKINTLAEQELTRLLSWREGYLVFAGDPLSYVVDEVNRYMPVTIEIADPTLSQLRIGGRFKVGELDAMFEVLETSFGVQVSRVDDQHFQLLPAPQ